jgi:predicted GNAT family acetyltransferase
MGKDDRMSQNDDIPGMAGAEITPDTQITVLDIPERDRFEAVLATGEVVGIAQYQLVPGQIVFTHTKVFDQYEGRGVGSTLVRGALDQVRVAGLTVNPLCPFVKAFIARHQEYADLMAS